MVVRRWFTFAGFRAKFRESDWLVPDSAVFEAWDLLMSTADAKTRRVGRFGQVELLLVLKSNGTPGL